MLPLATDLGQKHLEYALDSEKKASFISLFQLPFMLNYHKIRNVTPPKGFTVIGNGYGMWADRLINAHRKLCQKALLSDNQITYHPRR